MKRSNDVHFDTLLTRTLTRLHVDDLITPVPAAAAAGAAAAPSRPLYLRGVIEEAVKVGQVEIDLAYISPISQLSLPSISTFSPSISPVSPVQASVTELAPGGVLFRQGDPHPKLNPNATFAPNPNPSPYPNPKRALPARRPLVDRPSTLTLPNPNPNST